MARANIKSMFSKKKVVTAVIITFFTVITNYMVGNTSFPLPDEMKVLQICDKLKDLFSLSKDSIPDEVLLINVAFDKELIDYSINNIPQGNYVITDRKKLTDFLDIAQKANNYKYIFLDVHFRKGLITNYDSTLFSLISSMDRIVIPRHEDSYLQDTILYAKAANSDYTITWEETNFSRFQYIHQDIKSVPLRMYEDLYEKKMNQWGVLAFSNSWLCRNGVTLKLPLLVKSNNNNNRKLVYHHFLNLGTDILDLRQHAPIDRQIRGKIIVIGDFNNDIHDTYAGPQPGSLICLNAYYALINGDHLLLGKNLLFLIFMTFVYFILSLTYLNHRSIANYINNASIKAASFLFSATVFFWIVAFVVYILFDIVYNVWVPITIFSLLDILINIYQDRKLIIKAIKKIIRKIITLPIFKIFRHEKNITNNNGFLLADNNNSDCRKNENTILKQPSSMDKR